jgi:hypothetical protein
MSNYMQNLADVPVAVEVLEPTSITTVVAAGDVGTAVDTRLWRGQAMFVLHTKVTTTGNLTVKVVESDASDGTYTDVAGASFTAVTTDETDGVQKISVNADALKRFVKLNRAQSVTGASVSVNAIAIAIAQ